MSVKEMVIILLLLATTMLARVQAVSPKRQLQHHMDVVFDLAA
jgi:hypothetical protein